MANLYTVDSPITREQRNNINATFDDILRQFTSLRLQISILAGGADLEAIIERIEQTITNANNTTANTQQVLDDISDALGQLQQALNNSEIATQEATDAADQVSNFIAQTQMFIDEIGNAETYSNTKTYAKNNVVEYNGSSFMAIQETTGNVPPTLPTKRNDYWQLIAQRGVDGSGSVSAVNSIAPDVNGNVTLTPTDINAPTVDALFINVKNPPPPLVAAKGDGSDETSVLQAILNSIPNNSTYGTDPGKSGAIVFFPIGNYGVSSQLNVNALGTVLRGVSTETSVINALSGFTGESVIQFKQGNTGYSNVGVGMEKIGVYMNNVNAHGITVVKAYDGVTFSDITVRNIHDTKNGFRFIPDTNNTEKVSQTFILTNLQAIHANKTATAPLFFFDTCQEINLIGCKAFGTMESNLTSDYSDVPLCNGFEFRNSRGITMTGCSVAFTGLHGIKLYSQTRAATGFAMYGCTFESLGGIMKCEGTTNGYVDDVRVISFRREGSIGVGTGNVKGFELLRTRRSYLETKDVTVTVDNQCERNAILTEVSSNVTNSGLYTTVIGTANAVNNTFRIEPGITTPRANIDAFYADGVDQMSVSHPFGSGQTGLLLNINRDGTINKQRVTLGAQNSGGTGFRVLVVPN